MWIPFFQDGRQFLKQQHFCQKKNCCVFWVPYIWNVGYKCNFCFQISFLLKCYGSKSDLTVKTNRIYILLCCYDQEQSVIPLWDTKSQPSFSLFVPTERGDHRRLIHHSPISQDQGLPHFAASLCIWSDPAGRRLIKAVWGHKPGSPKVTC